MRRVAIEVTRTCDGACRFCAQRGLVANDPTPAAVEAEIDSVAAKGHEITFVGGEPTARPELVSWVARARERGAPRVGLQTHGRTLVDLASSLSNAGLTDLHLSIHGARDAVHDYHVDTPGRLSQTLAGLRAVQAASPVLVVGVATVVTRSNVRVLAELAPALATWGVQAWSLRWPIGAGATATAFDRLVPRVGLAAPFVLHAAAAAERAGLVVFVDGLPRCAMGPLARYDATLARSDPERFGAACGECSARTACGGLDPIYRRRFGDGELRPQGSNPVPPPDPTRATLARMFVGAGTLAPALDAPTADPPAKARARLPILGRPDPARDEIRGRARADDDAMRTLFPDLYERNAEAED